MLSLIHIYSSSALNDASKYTNISHIGCDETGSGDFFGPLCVVACYVDERDFDWLVSIGVRDPKDMDNKELVRVAKEIKDRLIYKMCIRDRPQTIILRFNASMTSFATLICPLPPSTIIKSGFSSPSIKTR